MIYEHISHNKAEALARTQTPIWGCAYDIDNETLHVRLRKEPVKGIFVKNRNLQFAELKKDMTPRTSGHVHLHARCYADTQEECIELYNQLVQRRINELQQMIASASADFIKKEEQ